MIEKESLTHRIEDDLERRNRNWDIIKAHLRNYTEQVGNPANLTTVSKEVVSAINELKDEIDTNKEELTQHKLDYASQRQQDKLKVTKVEKELNDFKGVINQVNINQEPKQKATGYGVISLPPNAAEGQINEIIIKGLTLNNQIENGNFRNGTNGFISYDGTLSVNSNKNLVFKVRSDIAVNYPNFRTTKQFVIAPNEKIFVYFKARVTNSECNAITLQYTQWRDSVTRINNPEANVWYEFYEIVTNTGTTARTFYFAPRHIYSSAEVARDKVMEIDGNTGIFLINMTALGIDDLTEDEMLNIVRGGYFEGTKSTFGAIRLKSVNEDESKESTLYVLGKDKEGNILELRSLPNGVKDEIDVSERKVIIRTKEVVLNGGENWSIYKVHENTISFQLNIPDKVMAPDNHGYVIGFNYVYGGYDKDEEGYSFSGLTNRVYININKNKLMTNDINGFKEWLSENPVTLIYQLATPIEIPIEVVGTLLSYLSGTVYVENVVADAGVYNDGITVLHQDLPIKQIESLYKVDFQTGLEYPLDISQCIISQDKLSFTHPELQNNDIVFFTYEYDVESTKGLVEMEHYDSRYVVKDDVTGKFYKWHIVVANGVPSIELEEV